MIQQVDERTGQNYAARYYAANAEKLRAYGRESSRRRYEESREAELERHRQYRDANPEKERARHRRWREANREKERAKRARHVARNREAVASESARRGGRCEAPGCDSTFRLQWHHRDPDAKVDAVANLVGKGSALARVQAELAKCDLLCEEHHRARHTGPWRSPRRDRAAPTRGRRERVNSELAAN